MILDKAEVATIKHLIHHPYYGKKEKSFRCLITQSEVESEVI